MSLRFSCPFALKLFAAAWVLLLPLVWLDDLPFRDTAERYIPMAQAMLNADWSRFFLLRVPLLFPALVGAALMMTGGTGIAAAQLVSATAFALTVFPLFFLLRRVFDPTTAKIGGVLYLFSSYLLRLGSSGLRESLKCLLLVWLTLALVTVWQERSRLRGYLSFAASGALMILVRDDSVLVVLLAGFALLGFDLVTNRFPWRAFTTAALAVVILTPALAANYYFHGYAMPSFRFVMLAEEFGIPEYALGRSPGPENPPESATAVGATAVPDPEPAATPEVRPGIASAGLEFAESLAKGLLWYFLIPATVVIVSRRRRRLWRPEENILLAVLVGHTLAIIGQIMIFDRYVYISQRYLLPAAPLELGWTALAAAEIARWAKGRNPTWQPLLRLAAAVLALALYVEALQPALRSRLRPRLRELRQATLELAGRIRSEMPPVYRAGLGMSPRVWSPAVPVLGVVAGGSVCRADTLGTNPPDFRLEPEGTEGLPESGFEPETRITLAGRSYVLWRRLSPAEKSER